jgi:hypothetical protein
VSADPSSLVYSGLVPKLTHVDTRLHLFSGVSRCPCISFPQTPLYYAQRTVLAGGEAAYLHATPKRERLRFYGGTEPVVAVRLRERTDADPPSPYFGWLATGASEYAMVWRSRVHFEACFQYDSDTAARKGRGRRVNLIVE